MNHREDDHEELRPRGEVTQIPDCCLEEDYSSRPRDRDTTISYTPESDSDSSCCTCGVSVPADRCKCLFCASNRIKPASHDSGGDETFIGVIFITAGARTEYEAVAKGTAACRHLVTTDGPIDSYQLVSEIDEPAPQLLARWGSLPAATETTSDVGQHLLERVLDIVEDDRTRWTTTRVEHAVLYDEWGTVIDKRDQIISLEHAPNQWLIPVLALQEQPSLEHSTRSTPRIPTKRRFFCRHCEEQTIHSSNGRDAAPDSSIPGNQSGSVSDAMHHDTVLVASEA